MRILYLLGTFPRVSSEACILNEIVEMKKLGNEIFILAGDKEDGAFNQDVLDLGILRNTIHFRDYNFINWKYFSKFQSKTSELQKRWSIGALKTFDFSLKIIFDILTQPIRTIDSIKLLIRIHKRIFSISDTYLGYRKIKITPDLIHVQFPHLNHLNQADFLSRKFECPFTITFRALDLHEKGSKKHDRMKARIISKAERIITISNFNRSVIKKKFNRDAHVIHSAINIEKFKSGNESSGKGNNGTIIYIGRFVKKKGIKYLIEACDLLKRRGIRLKLVLIGNGPLRNDYRRLISHFNLEDNVLIKELTPQEEIIKELERSDIFVLPTIVTESGDIDILSNSLKEAMAMEVPVVTTDISGIQELVEDHVSGILVRSKSNSDIADAIEELLSDPLKRRRMGKEGRKKIERDFNIEVEVKKLNSVFKEIVDRT